MQKTKKSILPHGQLAKIRKQLKKLGYSNEAIEEILKWYGE